MSFDLGKPIVQGLRLAGFDVWYFDDRQSASQQADIPGFRIAGIGEADVFMVLVTAHTGVSLGVAHEIALAQRYNVPILPVVLEDVPQVSNYPNATQAIKLDEVSEDSLQALAEALHALVESHPKNRESAQPNPSHGRKRITVDFVPRIFIAYSHKQRAIAKTLSDLLLKNAKPHFWDAKIKAGATWRQTIQRALDDSTHVIVIWTPDAAESDEVEREVSYALGERKVIVPILSKEIAKLPYHLHGLHYIVLDDDLSKIEADLLKAIAQFPGGEDIWQ